MDGWTLDFASYLIGVVVGIVSSFVALLDIKERAARRRARKAVR